MMKFTEIFRLKKMLEEANIPFQFSEKFNGFHIVYNFEGKVVCSVIEHEFSYGREKDLLEIQGLMTEQEMREEQDTVLGYLTADNVFGRIKMHWTSSIEADEFIKDLLDSLYLLDPYREVFKARIKRAEDFLSGVRFTEYRGGESMNEITKWESPLLGGFEMIKMHYPAKGDLPETSGEMCVQRKPVLAYTKSLGWTQAIRRQVGKGKFEWVCSSYDGNTLFSDDEITAWTVLPKPELAQWASCRCRHPKSNDLLSPPTEWELPREEEMESIQKKLDRRKTKDEI